MTEALAVCPHCAGELSGARPLRAGRWSVEADAIVMYDDAALPITAGEHTILATLIRAGGLAVPAIALGARVGRASDPRNTARILLHRLRRKLSAVGVPCPVETVSRRGMRWAGGVPA